MPVVVDGWKKAYKVVSAHGLNDLETRVEELMVMGFYCIDGVVIDEEGGQYLQTMSLSKKLPTPDESEEEDE